MVRIKVPATTANIGPGFDSLGCALSLYAVIDFEETDAGLLIDGCEPAYQNEENLMVAAYDLTMKRLNMQRKGLHIRFHSDIPISRGLGSSAALLVAGSMAANVLHGNTLDKGEILNICNQIEGHPDNVAPAIYGGLTASLVEADKPYSVRYPINEQACFCVLIPNFQTSTHEARKILPAQVDFKDAVYNVSRTAVLCRALETWDEELLTIALNDRLHQPYRSQLIHEYDKIRQICLKHGAAAFFISGSGPTCIALSKHADFSKRLAEDLKQCRHLWQAFDLKADLKGVESEEI
ncbi:homoserine kinase [Dielma fastidiosa]|uniref:Homoserine kinase n=1 Tax=Dielma fastidiosa TaxID=1034346 RepID=A0AB35UV07_9FIRM|nr:homoserine kinase [Dielma fastidiosa]MDY5169104.1 homoserine kinase [Dielma fastidiosa]